MNQVFVEWFVRKSFLSFFLLVLIFQILLFESQISITTEISLFLTHFDSEGIFTLKAGVLSLENQSDRSLIFEYLFVNMMNLILTTFYLSIRIYFSTTP